MTKKGFKRRVSLFVINHFLAGPKSFEKKRYLLRWAGYNVGTGVKVVAPIYITTELTIGKNTWIGKNFYANGNGTVTIGDNCDLGPEIIFQTGGHQIGGPERRAGMGVSYSQTVGNGTWIGGRTTIVGETHIGESCVITACACVTKSIPSNMMAGGVPAKVIRNL